MSYPDNSEQKKSKFGIVVILFIIFALVALGGLVVFLWSVSPIIVLIIIGLCFVVGVPAVLGLGLLVVIAGCGSDWGGHKKYYDWNNMPALKDRWPER